MTKTHNILVCLVLLFAMPGCQAPPIWEPGNDPIRVWAQDEVVWNAVVIACERWGIIEGFGCMRTSRGSSDVEVVTGDVIGAVAVSDAWKRWDGVWDYRVTLDYTLTDFTIKDAEERLLLSMTHEIGHLLGMWFHLEEGPAVMEAWPSSSVPTTLDLEALPFEVVAEDSIGDKNR